MTERHVTISAVTFSLVSIETCDHLYFLPCRFLFSGTIGLLDMWPLRLVTFDTYVHGTFGLEYRCSFILLTLRHLFSDTFALWYKCSLLQLSSNTFGHAHNCPPAYLLFSQVFFYTVVLFIGIHWYFCSFHGYSLSHLYLFQVYYR